jgi:hypothetical protein
MQLDLRLPIGWMFSLVGLMLIGFGYVSDEAIYAKSLGLNVNVWWGTVLLGFGIAMLGYARQAASRDRS